MNEIKAVFAVTAFAVLESLQVLIIVAHVYSFIPVRWDAAIPKGLEPERESFLYGIFLAAVLMSAAAAMKWVFPRIQTPSGLNKFSRFLALEALWVFLLLFAAFKGLTYRYPFYNVLPYENGHWVWPFFYVVLLASLASKIFWPEFSRWLENSAASLRSVSLPGAHRAVVYVSFAVGIFVLLLPDTQDVVALSYVWDQFNHWDDFWLCRWLLHHGGSYEQIVWVFFLGAVVFWSLAFVLVDKWLKSLLLAAFCVLVAVRMSLFHYGMAPVPWIFPQAILPWPLDVSAWQGLDNAPMYDALRVRLFFSFFAGFVLPLFYMFSLLLLVVPVIRKTFNTQVAAAALIAVYGLLTYPFYIARPTMYSYGAVALPAVLLLGFWIQRLARHFFPALARQIFLVLAVVVLGALLTSRVFVSYPHALNVYGQDYSKERQLLKEILDELAPDAAFVARWVKPGEKAAVIGSFEMALLNQAKRPGFFKQSPLITSTPLAANALKGLRLKAKQPLLITLTELEKNPPPYIFVERKLFQLPPDFYKSQAGLAVLLSWVANHYKTVEQGKYYLGWQKL